MSVLTKMERKTFKGRLFLGGVFLALTLGGITMIYPFLLMVSGAVRSEMDSSNMNLVPAYFYDTTVLTRKFLERKYNYDVAEMNRHRPYRDISFSLADIPDVKSQQQLQDLETFFKSGLLPDHWQIVGGTEIYKRTTQPNQHRLVEIVYNRFDGDLERFSESLGTIFRNWQSITFAPPDWTSRRFEAEDNALYQAYFQLMHERPVAERATVLLNSVFLENVIYPSYGRYAMDDYNEAHEQDLTNYSDLSISQRVPDESQPVLRKEWLFFVHEVLNTSFIRTDVSNEQYQAFLKTRYENIEGLNNVWSHTQFASFDEITLPQGDQWIPAGERIDYREFIKTVPAESLYLVGPEFIWRQWLKDQYTDLDQLNTAYGTNYADWSSVGIPIGQLEHQYVLDHATSFRLELITSNFQDVLNEIVLQGRPLVNTVVYVLLALFFSLTLQPLAAYAISRFDPPYTWQIILIFMATMAFPPMVGMIPQFLILRNLHLLNTFAALVLPVMVNGYLIFLLKGFFDSLPQHLYEAAMIDGASEIRMFWQITMALSKPILAVVALQTFNLAWMTFMYPLLVAPDESMHVLAVWLYQFQQEAPTSAVFASIMITSIPTLLIFVFTQRTIMRGIAVPAEK